MALNFDSMKSFLQQASQFLPLAGALFPENTKVGKAGRSYAAQMFGHELTGAQREANAFTMSMQKDAQAYNAQQAQINRDYQTQMSNTAYQRQVADMQAAGVNPALAMTGNAGASTPSGGAASAGAGASVSPYGGNLLDVIMQMKQLEIQRKLADAEIANKNAQTEGIEIDNSWKDVLNQLAVESQNIANNLTEEQTKKVNDERSMIKEQINKLIAECETEFERKLLTQAERFYTEASTKQIVEMMPYQIALTKAQTDAQKASAAVEWLNAAKERKLIDSGYYDEIVESAKLANKEAGIRIQTGEVGKDRAVYDYLLHSGQGIKTKVGRALFHGLQNLGEVTGGLGAILGIGGAALGIGKVASSAGKVSSVIHRRDAGPWHSTSTSWYNK